MMLPSPAYISLLLLPISALQIPSVLSPFHQPRLDKSLLISNETLLPPPEIELRKRDGNCPANYNSCSTLAKADGGACCLAGSTCTLDHARNIACCPIGASCTGTIQIATATATTTTGGGVGIVFGTTTTTTTGTAATATITGSASYVTNPYFPYPYITNSWTNSADCVSAYNDCQSNYAACTVDLQGGGGNGVTIVAPGGGTTVAATAMNLGLTSATSICSSLSKVACYGLITQNCAQYETAFVVSTTRNGAPRQTAAACFARVAWAGVGLGLAIA